MSVYARNPSFFICLCAVMAIGWVFGAAAAAEAPGWAGIEPSLRLAIKTGDIARAEQIVRSALKESAASNADIAQNETETRKMQGALAVVLGAKAFEAERRNGSKLSGSDFLCLVVVLILASYVVSLVLRYGPQRPKIVEGTNRWVERMKAETSEDGMKQTSTALFSMLIFALIAGVLFLFMYGAIHVVAQLDASTIGPDERKYLDEGKEMLRASMTDHNSEVEDQDVLLSYAQFLREAGNERLSLAVMGCAKSMKNRADRCRLPAKEKKSGE